MEVSFVDERSYERRESILVSPPTPSPRDVKSIKLVAADDEQEAETCEHFTIRGYVSGIRKRDAKSCWPFFMFHNHKSDEHTGSLPPLPVTKFRQWNCQNCLRKTNAPAVAVANGALSRSQNDELKGSSTSFLGTTIAASHADEKISLPGIQKLSTEKIREDPIADTKCCAKKANEFVLTDLITEGFQISKACRDSCEDIQNQSGDTPTSVLTEGRACQMGGRGERNAVQINTLGTAQCAHCVDAPDLVNEIAYSAVAPDPTFMGINVSLPAQKQCNEATGYVYDIDSMGLDKNDHEASDKNKGLTDASKVLNSAGKLHHKKARKVRLLDDIMRSEELCLMSKKVHSSDGDAKGAQIQNDIDRGPDASKGKDQHLDHKIHLANQKTKVEPIKSKTAYKALENEDGGPSPMYWLKKVNKDPVTHKEDAENIHINFSVNSKSAVDASVGKGLDLIHEGSGDKGNRLKDFVHGKQNEMPRVYLMPQQKIMTEKLIIAEDAATKIIHSKTMNSKLKGIRTTGKNSHHDPKLQDRSHTKAIMSKKKNTEPQVEDNESSQVHLSKDSFAKYDRAIMSGFQGQKKATKKRRTMRTCEKEALDGIPMDIVELLAKNQHERRLMDAKAGTATMHNLSETPDKIKDSNALDVTESHRNIVLDAVFNDIFRKKNLSNNIIDGSRSYRNVDETLTANCPPSNGKQNINMDLKQRELIGASTGLLKLPQSISKNDCFAQSYSWNRMGIRASPAISVQNSPVLVKGTAFGVKPRNVDSNDHDSLLQRKLKALAHETDDLKSENQDGTLLLNEIMPAMHLLKLMDSATWSGASLHKPSDVNHAGFIQESDFHSNNQGNESRPKSNAAPPVQGQHHGNPCKPFRPHPVIGVFGSLLQKEITTRSSNCGTQSGFMIGQSNEPASRKTNGEGTSERSHAATGARAPERPLRDSVSHLPKSRCEMEICGVNRNPADFTVLDEDNAYMIVSEDQKRRHICPSEYLYRPDRTNGQKRQKVMKIITTSKGLVRS